MKYNKNKISTKAKRLFMQQLFLLTLYIILLSTFSSAYFNPFMDDWYSVEQWEVDFCNKYGGGMQPVVLPPSMSQGGIAAASNLFLSQTTMTLQAEHTGTSRIANSTLHTYTVGWYVQPISETSSYSITLINILDPEDEDDDGSNSNNNPPQEDDCDGTSIIIARGVYSPERPSVGYKVDHLECEYDIAQLQTGSTIIQTDIQ